ncbi:MAG: MFS transporter [Gammaproteobacteria bacterium]|nr:MFS transporter [Gammaproteobacteria bacterium]
MPAPYGRLLLPVYVPSLLVSASQTALLILLPLYVLELGYSAALAATIVGVRGVGLFLFDVPAGILASRFGDRAALQSGLLLILVGTVLLAISANSWVLALGAFFNGAGFAAWMLGRQSYIADTCENDEIGRAIAVMAGLQRVGIFIGPGLGGLLAAATSYSLMFVVSAGVTLVATFFVVAFCRADVGGDRHEGAGLAATFAIARKHAKLFATAGSVALSLQLMRATRQLLVPLFGVAVGLDAAQIGLIYSLSAGIDMCLFYPVGLIVDRHGRKWSAIPSLVLFSIGLLLLPMIGGFGSLLAVACLLGIANGMGTGIVMIIGADLSRRAEDRGQFLGVWRLIGDAGMSGAPLISAGLLTFATLGAASVFAAGLGVVGALVMLTLVPETLERKRQL